MKIPPWLDFFIGIKKVGEPTTGDATGFIGCGIIFLLPVVLIMLVNPPEDLIDTGALVTISLFSLGAMGMFRRKWYGLVLTYPLIVLIWFSGASGIAANNGSDISVEEIRQFNLSGAQTAEWTRTIKELLKQVLFLSPVFLVLLAYFTRRRHWFRPGV